MSLNWDINRIKDMDTVCWTPCDDPDNVGGGMFQRVVRQRKDDPEKFEVMTWECHMLLFVTMNVGMGTITEKNWPEFYFRVAVYETLFGAYLYKDVSSDDESEPRWEPNRFTPETIRKHIGLSTNVSKETRSAWIKRTMEYYERDVIRPCIKAVERESDQTT